MPDLESEDNLRPHELGRRQFEPSFFSDSDDEPEVRDYDSDSCSAATSTCSSPPDGITLPSDFSIEDLGDAAINQFRSSRGGEDVEIASVASTDSDIRNPASLVDIENLPAPRAGRSIADPLINNKMACFPFDIETVGEYGGIVQISAEMIMMDLRQTGRSSTKDRLEDCYHHTDVFNSYVNPGDNAIWDHATTAVHGLRRTDPRIVNAPPIHTAWSQFRSWFDRLSREFSG